MKTPIVDLLNDAVPELIAWCTPSVLQAQRQVMNIYASGMSISYEAQGNPEAPPWRAESGVFGEAYRLAAEAYWGEHYQTDTHHCLFSVNGSSGSNFMVIKALKLHLGERLHLLAQRNMHKSIIDACGDYHARLTILEPRYHPDYQIFMPNLIEDYVTAFQADPSINVVLISNPTYEGFSLDLQSLIARLRAIRDVIIFVDEAWGSNFYFDRDNQPRAATDSGADIAVISTHKQGGSLQQTGILLWRDASYMVDRETMFHSYQSLLTTSPSWHLLASIDASRAYFQKRGKLAIRHITNIAEYLIDGLQQLLPLITPDDLRAAGSSNIIGMDKSKVLFFTAEQGITGYVIAEQLEKQNIVVEKNEESTLLLLVPFQRSLQDAEKTVNAIEKIVENTPPTPRAAMLPMPANFKKCKEPFAITHSTPLRLKDAIGAICAENITPYPPGIPLIIRGEQVQAQHIAYMQHLSNIGSTILMYDNTHQTILVEA